MAVRVDGRDVEPGLRPGIDRAVEGGLDADQRLRRAHGDGGERVGRMAGRVVDRHIQRRLHRVRGVRRLRQAQRQHRVPGIVRGGQRHGKGFGCEALVGQADLVAGQRVRRAWARSPAGCRRCPSGARPARRTGSGRRPKPAPSGRHSAPPGKVPKATAMRSGTNESTLNSASPTGGAFGSASTCTVHEPAGAPLDRVTATWSDPPPPGCTTLSAEDGPVRPLDLDVGGPVHRLAGRVPQQRHQLGRFRQGGRCRGPATRRRPRGRAAWRPSPRGRTGRTPSPPGPGLTKSTGVPAGPASVP